MPATTAETLSLVTRQVSVAPLVLLSAADHYGRSAKGTRNRVVGVLLGQNDGKNVRVSNSFAGETGLLLSFVIVPAENVTAQSPSKKMTKTARSGSSITTTSSQ
jgi:JAB1/Mov34/MPN/PAD-1 ubiquitin protease